LAGRRQRKRAPLKKCNAQVLLQLRHLAAHGGLLNAVWNIANSFS